VIAVAVRGSPFVVCMWRPLSQAREKRLHPRDLVLLRMPSRMRENLDAGVGGLLERLVLRHGDTSLMVDDHELEKTTVERRA
jgi:hypothetical protein